MHKSFMLPGLDDLPDHPGPDVEDDDEVGVGGEGEERDPPSLRLTRTWGQTLRWHTRSPAIIAAAAAAVVLIAVGALALRTPNAPPSPTDADPVDRTNTVSSAIASAGVTPMSPPSAGQTLQVPASTVRVTEYVTVTVTSATKAPATGTSTAHASQDPGTVPPTP